MRPDSDRSWILFASTTFILFGLTNFLLGYIGETSGNNMEASISSIILLWTGMGVLGIIMLLSPAISVEKIRETFRMKTASSGILAGITLALGMFTLKAGFISDPGSKGPIVAIASANAMFVAFSAWIFLKERLSRKQLFGMVIILSGILLITLGGDSFASFRGVIFGISTLLLYGITNYLLKYAGHKGGDPLVIAVLLWISAGCFGITSIIISIFSGRGLKGLDDIVLIFLSLITGFILGLGMLTLKISLKRGPAGPAIAISGSNAVLVLILDLLVFGHLPSSMKILGMTIVIAGIIVIALAKRREVN